MTIALVVFDVNDTDETLRQYVVDVIALTAQQRRIPIASISESRF